ncbi:chromate efflux transporter [Micavibrio aeruginosavorus]|uniref:Chromate transport protein ChrA n=1 Tax=Micavibrio aeruginosavorus EPB TaxID=349215 RepID=M4VHF7_9BACT|nr:chromate efflux transporter [Micavibrio aeruginosavorus]AGH97925.1 Chromate transport protein ChrA [Micavibrio aeruginosavorus EPB]
MMRSYLALFWTFLKFGLNAWGGPVAQIDMIRHALVEREQWISPDKFRRALAVYQALPGPEAHELCVYMGMVRMGRLGGLLAGLGFMLPGFVFILILSALYVRLGADVLLPIFVGVAPAVVALIVRALYRMGRHTLDTPILWFIALASCAMTFAGVHFLVVFAAALTIHYMDHAWPRPVMLIASAIIVAGFIASTTFASPTVPLSVLRHGGLFIEGLKAGMLSFGGAYTVLPFLENSMVGLYPNITLQHFVDGIALSSIIPAPMVIFGTYLGYLVDGVGGAILMTLGIFLPAFGFTLLGHNHLEKIIENPSWHGGLHAIAAAVIGLFAVTTATIAHQTLTAPVPVVLALAALAAISLIRWKWVIPVTLIASGCLGFALSL